MSLFLLTEEGEDTMDRIELFYQKDSDGRRFHHSWHGRTTYPPANGFPPMSEKTCEKCGMVERKVFGNSSKVPTEVSYELNGDYYDKDHGCSEE